MFSSYLTGNILRLRYKVSRLMRLKETVALYCENHTERRYTLWEQNAEYVTADGA
jgi:hypothetical protein